MRESNKRWMGILIGLALAFTGIAHGGGLGAELPLGTFEGVGTWKGPDGSSGEYRSRITVEAGAIRSSWVAERGAEPQENVMRLADRGDGFYDVLDKSGEPSGWMACLDGTCTYTLSSEGVRVQETLRYDEGGVVVKSGLKEFGGYRIVWKETLSSGE